MSSPVELKESKDPNAIIVSMENLFLIALRELEPHFGYLMTDRFGSHALRVLLLVLAGQPILKTQRKGPLQSKKKEHVHVNGAAKSEETVLEKRQVPEAFHDGLATVISKSVEGLDTSFLQGLAMHPTANPTLQVLLQLDLSQFGKERAKNEDSVLRKLLPDDPVAEGTESARFLSGLIYDPVGSRLFETIVEHAPAKTFKAIYREFFKERLASLGKNEIAGYVVMKVLSRIGKDDLQEAVDALIPQLSLLVERNRTALIKTLIERCTLRGVPTDTLAAGLDSAYGGPNGFDIARLLKLADPAVDTARPGTGANGEHRSAHSQSSEKLHGSLLAQTMIATPGPLSDLIFDALARLGAPLTLSASKTTSAAHTISAALTSPNASIIFRRKMIQQFYGHVGEMALHPSASHIIDAVWTGTHGLAFIRERVAEELAENEASMRESIVGRKVWKNWRMDLYKRRRRDWLVTSRESAGRESFVGFPGDTAEDKENGDSAPHLHGAGKHRHKHHKDKGKAKPIGHEERHMTALERARRKHAEEKARKEREALKTAKAEKKHKNDGKGKEIAVA
jgi:nucleolar protein 9